MDLLFPFFCWVISFFLCVGDSLVDLCFVFENESFLSYFFFQNHPPSSNSAFNVPGCTQTFRALKSPPYPPPPPTMYGSQNQCSVFNDNESNFLVCSRVCRWLFSMEFQWSFLRCWWLCDFVVSLTGRRRFFFVSLSLSLSLSLCCLCHSVPASLLHSSVEPTNERGKKKKK